MTHIPLWKVIFLGALQGLTEFLPVSSSAHLVIYQQYLHLSHDGAFLMAFDVALHGGTLLALLVVFYKDLLWLVKDKVGFRIGLYLILATIPAAIVGAFLKDFFETLFADLLPASFFLLITGWILWFTKKKEQPGEIDFDNMQPKQALLVGAAQAVAILPGISRSGSTIAAGLLQKFKPETAVRFSFLMAIPVVTGALVLESGQFAAMDKGLIFPLLAGTLTAFFVGLAAIRWMLKLVSQRHIYRFAYYCWIFGGFVFLKELFF